MAIGVEAGRADWPGGIAVLPASGKVGGTGWEEGTVLRYRCYDCSHFVGRF